MCHSVFFCALYFCPNKTFNMAYIRQGVLHELVERLQQFSITWATEHGHWATVEHATCTSWHSSGDTMNIKDTDTGNLFTVIIDTIKLFNGKEVVL